uniref:Uncharacterized protein n=1 Tax=Meloidogyne enterolobii TaxID=390850 RepID=A0A6V7VCU9_MELEN|nr:unnamed protein product [Meloidogyne enterolobii]
MPLTTNLLLFILIFISIQNLIINGQLNRPEPKVPHVDPHHYQPSLSACYDEFKRPQRCVPDFINVAFNLEVEATNTCGVRAPTRFCVQTGHMGSNKVCDVCDVRVPQLAHSPIYLTDFNNPENATFWQSETMAEGMQYPQTVNLTLRLHKRFDITYVHLKFVSPRPESFVIYKKVKNTDDWIPWQYYSGSCRSTFKLPEKAPILPGNEAMAQCTREFSDISPLTGGNIAFSTLEGRPSSEIFEERLGNCRRNKNLFSSNEYFWDEIFGDNRVLRSYYYGISDFAVGGRCKCNGHANKCTKSTGEGVAQQLVCDCQHNTTGIDCGECAPFYLDRPWRPATAMEANECLPCNCSGLSKRCFFDAKLFEETGHGGHCIDCAGNTQGPHCEQCLPNHWRHENELYCRPCHCSETGSIGGQCDEKGQCHCKPGVTGQFCDRCESGFYGFSSAGCKDCKCDVSGSLNNTPSCSPNDGVCTCKENVEGRTCSQCKPGHFQLSAKNPFGCTPCFCFGHSSICSPADGFYSVNISSYFNEDVEKWTGASSARPEDVQWAQLDKAAAVSQLDDFPVYFYTPEKFLGDQRQIYNQFIEFTLRVQQANPGPSKKDIVIVGANGQELVLPIFAQGNPLPSATQEQHYRFRIHSNPSLQWSPTLRETDFIAALYNVSAIKLRGTFSKGDVGFLSNFSIGTASLTPAEYGETESADWVEQCKCSDAFVGQFCESCSHGYKRVNKFGGPLDKCIPCECHNHSSSCDAESGVCICQHNTAGDTCESCARGYYGDALAGTPDDCKQCDCPEGGPCTIVSDGTYCTDCPEGYTGRKCEICAEEYFGNPFNGIACQKCNCNNNTDLNAIGKCDTVTGECKRCIYHTIGWNCERCEPGFWGNALAEIKGDCKQCNCYVPGTLRPTHDHSLLECRQSDGQCDCQPNVIGQRCDQCEPGFYNISSGSGCHSCGCDPLGSSDAGVCDLITGQCLCKTGVTGRKCDKCAPRHFGFNLDGCKQCDCDPVGSESLDCDTHTGQCLCRHDVEGRRCDKCSENRYDLRRQCPACDDCYALIQSRKNSINESMAGLRESLDEIQNNPITVNDAEFDDRVRSVKEDVDSLVTKAGQKFAGNDEATQIHVINIKEQFSESGNLLENVRENLRSIDTNSAIIEAQLERFAKEKEATSKELNVGINYVQTQGEQHLASAQEAADRYGEKSQQLSDFAEEAKRLADQQEQRKREIFRMSEKVRNGTRQALNDANEAIFGASSSVQRIAAFQTEVNELEKRLNSTKHLALEQSAETNKTHDDAARVLSSVESVRLPNILPDSFRTQSDTVHSNGEEALKKVELGSTTHAQLYEESGQLLIDSKNQLEKVKEKQHIIDKQFEEIDNFHKRTNEAFNLATKIWNDAKESYDALSDFHGKIEQSRSDALNELSGVQEIQDELISVEEQAKEAELALIDIRRNSEEARNFAEEAKLKAENLEKESTKLGENAEETNKKSEEIKNLLDTLQLDIDRTSTTTKDFENEANSDMDRSNEVAKKANLAESMARTLQDNLTESEKILFSALNQLNSLENVNESQLTELETILEDTERQYIANEKEQKMRERMKRVELDALADKRQIDYLTKELENLRGIRDSLPTRCYNLINLEQEGQR